MAWGSFDRVHSSSNSFSYGCTIVLFFSFFQKNINLEIHGCGDLGRMIIDMDYEGPRPQQLLNLGLLTEGLRRGAAGSLSPRRSLSQTLLCCSLVWTSKWLLFCKSR